VSYGPSFCVALPASVTLHNALIPLTSPLVRHIATSIASLANLVFANHPNTTMSISQTTEIPTLAGGCITLGLVQNATTDTRLRRTKIVCTIGPACWEIPQLEKMMQTGMNVARFNFSHGDHEGHGAVLERVRKAAENQQKNVGEFEKVISKAMPDIRLQPFSWIPRAPKFAVDSLPTEPRRLTSSRASPSS